MRNTASAGPTRLLEPSPPGRQVSAQAHRRRSFGDARRQQAARQPQGRSGQGPSHSAAPRSDNAGFEEGPRTEAEFDRWAPSALEAVSELRALTRERLGTV